MSFGAALRLWFDPTGTGSAHQPWFDVAHQPLSVAWKALAGYISDTGDTSVKACLETGVYTAFDTIVVTRSVVGDVTIGGVTYKGAQFDLDITGSGA